ncbi:2-oxoglutarate dehydrogenase, E2 component, dihydrolipoamide succinyltransferase [Quadrisphaera sp. GCM10027208]|uniref:2-oxoglutarate dehydrogenase, E2 component, dihydrolipoamide succinyltransferase n=1 Tax=Quadrisphaera sp. GCM10027208 TaxID=3273423 RepID=UPI003616D058
MSNSVEMPALGESVTEGTVTRWLKQVGDTVEVDEPLLEVSTDKVDTEIPSPFAGTLTEILVDEDETVEVGAKLAVIGEPSEAGGLDAGGTAESSDDAATEQASQEEPTRHADQDTEEPQVPPEASVQDTGQQDTRQQDTGQQDTGQQGTDQEGTPVTMPALGESVTEGTVTRWLKSEGDTVEVDEPLLEVSTDKVDTEIPSPVAGTIQKILVSEDETVEVGAQLAIVGSASGGGGQAAPAAEQPRQDEPGQDQAGQDEAGDDEDVAAGSLEKEAEVREQAAEQAEAATQPSGSTGAGEQAAEERRQPAAQEAAPAQDESPSRDERTTETRPSAGRATGDNAAYVTPLVRKLAAEHGVDLSTVEGTGVGGRIRKQDVLAAAQRAAEEARQPEQPAAQPAGSTSGGPARRPAPAGAKRGTTERMSRLRKVIAARMVESLQTSAQLTTVVEVDVTKIARLRARAKADFEAREGVKLSFLPFFALATVEALKAHPVVNASIEGDEIVYHGQENLGVAVDTERGLLVPVIRDAGDLNIAGLARKIADLAERTRANKVTPDELSGGTFTLTNTGSRGALFDTPIINQPNVGILGTGSVVKRPVVIEVDGAETIAIRSMMYLALSYDHRLVDGADAARFLATIKERLEEGAFEADLGL